MGEIRGFGGDRFSTKKIGPSEEHPLFRRDKVPAERLQVTFATPQDSLQVLSSRVVNSTTTTIEDC